MRHANERAYQEAVNLWLTATADPESHPHWMQFYANALRDAIRKANNRRKDALAELTTTDDKSVGIVGCRNCQFHTDKSGE